ncbi:hypothetical protein CBS101457_000438 [Exobasidium rhododendri]|nr:hypothetical protein CBS101457_000438 [Exobasidium rhododendri]
MESDAIERFYEEDVVAYAGDVDDLATVLYTWRDEDDDDDDVPLIGSLQVHQYKILWASGRMITAHASELKLLDRSFQIGDICRRVRRGAIDLMTGVVVDLEMKVALQTVVTQARRDGLMSSRHIRPTAGIRVGDNVIHNHWVGVVERVFEEGLLSIQGETEPQKFICTEAVLNYGTPTDKALESMQGLCKDAYIHRKEKDLMRVIAVQQTHALITWLAINQKLSQAEAELFPMPRQVWTNSMAGLTVIQNFEEHKYALGDNVYVASEESKSQLDKEGFTIEGDSRREVLAVIDCRSNVEVLWQDGTRSLHCSTELEEPATIDDHHVWCGEHVIYRNLEGSERGAVVQSMDAKEQTATIIFYGDNKKTDSKVVPLLECKAEGSAGYPYGINRGDVVLISSGGTGYPPPGVPMLGSDDEVAYDDYDLEETMSSMGKELAEASPDGVLSKPIEIRSSLLAHEIDWYGVVIDCAFDGHILVELPDGRRVKEMVGHLTRLAGDEDESEVDEEEEQEYEDSDASCTHATHTSVPWVTSDGQHVDDSNAEEMDWEDAEDVDSNEEDSVEGEESAAGVAREGAKYPVDLHRDEIERPSSLDALNTSFKVLELAPKDHYYLNRSPSLLHRRAFLSRIQREYRILSSSLPDEILVRSYEDRMDLFRTIIIGSQGTPYQDAPFCIDFYLGANFPDEPPRAHFHSWSQGHGRVSPNLYEEGRICLSLLNTWQGQEEVETWNPEKSTLLQILVSVKALVLVVEPYFTEPGYERLMYTEAGRRNSQLYSERAFVLSRRFILHAIKTGVEGFQEELQATYYRGGRLTHSIEKIQELIDLQEAGREESSENTLLKITKGGKALLLQIMSQLQVLQRAPQDYQRG